MAAIGWRRCAIRATSFCHGRNSHFSSKEQECIPEAPGWWSALFHRHIFGRGHPGSHPHAPPQPARGNGGWRSIVDECGRTVPCRQSHIRVTSITIKNTHPLLSPAGGIPKAAENRSFSDFGLRREVLLEAREQAVAPEDHSSGQEFCNQQILVPRTQPYMIQLAQSAGLRWPVPLGLFRSLRNSR